MSLQYNFSTGEVLQLFSENQYSGLLLTNTVQTLTVPTFNTNGISSDIGSSKVICVISINTIANVWVSNSGAPSAPTGSIASTNSELIPIYGTLTKVVKMGSTLSFITSDNDVQYGVVFYQSL